MIQLHCDFSFCSQFPLKIHFQIIDAKSEQKFVIKYYLNQKQHIIKKTTQNDIPATFQQMQTHCCMVGWWGIFDAIMMNDFFIEINSDFCVVFYLLLKFWSTNKLYKKLKRSVGIIFWVWWLHMTYDTVFILVYESCDSECQFYHNCRDFCFFTPPNDWCNFSLIL